MLQRAKHASFATGKAQCIMIESTPGARGPIARVRRRRWLAKRARRAPAARRRGADVGRFKARIRCAHGQPRASKRAQRAVRGSDLQGRSGRAGTRARTAARTLHRAGTPRIWYCADTIR